MFSLDENMIDYLLTLGVLLLIPGALLGAMYYLNKGEEVRTQTYTEKNELQRIINECLLRSDLA